jgi:peptide/nickel transport system ATP-binding protein
MGGRASIPSAWPAPFTLDGKTPAHLVDLGDGHFVRLSGDADPAAALRTVETAA